MNSEEARVLHGLYFHREMIGEAMFYSAGEINWLAKTPLPHGRTWEGRDGKLQALESKADDYLASIGATSAASEKPLAYLQAVGYITYTKDSGGFRIKVTGRGADLARELDTTLGRINLLYKKHKDGVIWFLATVLVSLITTLVTQCRS